MIFEKTDCCNFEWEVCVGVRGHGSGWMIRNNRPFALTPTFEDGRAVSSLCKVWPQAGPGTLRIRMMIARTLPDSDYATYTLTNKLTILRGKYF